MNNANLFLFSLWRYAQNHEMIHCTLSIIVGVWLGGKIEMRVRWYVASAYFHVLLSIFVKHFCNFFGGELKS